MGGFAGKQSAVAPFVEPVGSLRNFAVGLTVDSKYVLADGRAATPDMDIYSQIAAPAAFTWRNGILPLYGASSAIPSLCYGNGLWVGAYSSPTAPAIVVSTNGLDFKVVPLTSMGDSPPTLVQMVYDSIKKRFLALAASSYVYECYDPTTGVFAPIGAIQTISTQYPMLCCSTGRIIFMSAADTIGYTDNDFVTVTTVVVTAGVGNIINIVEGVDGVLTACVVGGAFAYWSSNYGATWNACTGMPVTPYPGVRDMAFGLGRVILLGNNGNTYVSTDGKAFVLGNASTGMVLIAFSGNTFIIIGGGSSAWTTVDGVTLTTRTRPLSGLGNMMVVAGGGWMMVHGGTTASRQIMISTDGTSKLLPNIPQSDDQQTCVRAYK